ncbi:hypothetical protein L208DRAFT_1412032, partial [Tricholoma matsutake]
MWGWVPCCLASLLSIPGTVFLFLLWWGNHLLALPDVAGTRDTLQAEAHRRGAGAGCSLPVLGVVVS